MHMHLPHFHLPQLFHNHVTQTPPTPRDHIPTTEELARLFRAADADLHELDTMHAAEHARYERMRRGIIGRMADLIEANERFHGTDLRNFR